MATVKCAYCGHENIVGSDHCTKCLHSFTQQDQPQPTKEKLQKLIMTEAVADFISKVPPIIVQPKTPMKDVIEKMQANPTKGCVLVCDSANHLVGILSIRDVLLRVAGVLKDLSTPVEKVMTPRPECLQKDAPLSFALNKMSINKFRHVPVLDGDKPIGVVSTRDIIEYLSTKRKKN